MLLWAKHTDTKVVVWIKRLIGYGLGSEGLNWLLLKCSTKEGYTLVDLIKTGWTCSLFFLWREPKILLKPQGRHLLI